MSGLPRLGVDLDSDHEEETNYLSKAKGAGASSAAAAGAAGDMDGGDGLSEFPTYEDYLDSQILPEDMKYLEVRGRRPQRSENLGRLGGWWPRIEFVLFVVVDDVLLFVHRSLVSILSLRRAKISCASWSSSGIAAAAKRSNGQPNEPKQNHHSGTNKSTFASKIEHCQSCSFALALACSRLLSLARFRSSLFLCLSPTHVPLALPLSSEEFEARKREIEQLKYKAAHKVPKILCSAGREFGPAFPFLQALADREEMVRNGKLTSIIFIRDKNAKGQEVSGYIDFAHRLKIEDFTPYFAKKKKLIPRPADLSYYNWETQTSDARDETQQPREEDNMDGWCASGCCELLC